jgi:cephalosporin-C deacetylase
MPLTFDFPLEKLQTYQGINPCPSDMDEFWDASIEEMHGVDPNIELIPAYDGAPNVECFDLYFTGVGGARIYAKYLRPRGAGPGSKLPAVVKFHGYSGSSGDWFDQLPWPGQGFCVAAMDCRGQGGRSQDIGGVRGTTHSGHIIRGLDDASPKKLLFRDIFLDTAQLARIVMDLPEVDEARVGAGGGSQGGALTLACAALEPNIKRAAPVFPFLCDYKRVWEMDQAERAYAELKTFFRAYNPLHEREDALFTRLGYIDCQHLAKRIKAEVLLGIGLMDQICPPSTQFAAYNKISAKKRMLVYPDFGHERLPGMEDHTLTFMGGM